jgi:hypothetical protein
MVLAGDLMISELMVDNNSTIDDEDGVPSDWFEVFNAGDQAVDLTGWFVTDDAADRTKWMFRGGSLAPGQTQLVFASGKDRSDPTRTLHTNFRLSEADYLALYRPDGRTLVDVFETLPAQYEDISYGDGQTLVDRQLAGSDGTRQVLFPTSAAQDVPTATWTAADFDASTWSNIGAGIGYDVDLADGDFNPLISADGNSSAQMKGNTASAYVRAEFDMPAELATYRTMGLTVNYDDGFVAYLNGHEIARANAPEALAWDATATAQHGGIEALMSYPSFALADDKDDFTLNGNAQWNGDRLTLTPPVADQAATAWLTRAVPFGPDYTFSASMVYDIHTPGGTFADGDRDGLGGEGITFTLQSSSEQLLGASGGGLGLDNTGATFLAIELDSKATGSFDPDDTLPSHLGITTSDGSLARVAVPRFNGNGFLAGQPGPGVNKIYLWVDYVGGTGQLDVYMATNGTKPAAPTLSATVNLAELFGGDPELFTGWTASTSKAFNGHDVLSLSMSTGVGQLGTQPVSLDVSQYVDRLQPGKNVLAIHALNVTSDDEDFLIRAELSAQEVQLSEVGYFLAPTPDDLNGVSSLAPSEVVTFSRDSQIYVEPFTLEITPPSPEATIYYTLDGSIPTEASSVYTTPLNIDGPVRVRARAVQPGHSLSPIMTVGFTQLDTSLSNFENGEVFSSNLPLIVFEGFGQSPDRQTLKLAPTVGYFISPGADGKSTLLDAPDYAGRAGLRGRGQSSEGWPKKQYALELWDEGNDDSITLRASEARDKNVSLFGLPADSDWVLNGPYSDKTQLNNFLTFNWFNEIGLYAPRTRLVEVFVNTDNSKLDFNSDYRGTYVLLEKIKIDQNRVNIAELQPGDTDPEIISGGYIWKKDKAGAADSIFNTESGQQFRMVEPQGPVSRTDIRPGEITEVQKTWLQTYVNEFEAALYGPNFADPRDGYAKYIDVDSWVDTWLMVEMTKNIDGFRLSTYYYKDRGGKIHQGPAWDYNLSLGNANYLQGAYPEGWYGGLLGNIDYPYWNRLFEDANFAQKVADRWTELRQTVFTTENLMADIDAALNQLSNGNPNFTKLAPGEPSNPISRNYDRWTTGQYGEGAYFWPNCFFGVDDCPPSPLPTELTPNGRPNSYDDYVFIMKWFLENRLNWMDSQFAPPLTVSPPSGPVERGTQVSITAPAGYGVYYTLDGTDPRAPLLIDEEHVVLDTGAAAQVTVPTDDTLIDKCDDGLRLTNAAACFMNIAYQPGANGETWTDVTMPIGYDTAGDYAALISSDVQGMMHNNNSSIYIRIPFNVDQSVADNATSMKLSARYDDGFVAYLWFNTLRTPVQIAKSNVTTGGVLPIRALAYNAAAEQTNPDELAVQYQDFDVSSSAKYLRGGETNYLVIQALNESAAGDDFLMDFKLTIGTQRVEVNPSVLRYTGPVTVDRNMHLIARGFDQNANDWTGPATLTYVVDAPALSVTEINYNPYEPTQTELASDPDLDNEDFEYVELKNVGSQPVNLVGVEFDGFELTLGNVELAAGEYGVVVRDASAFALRYGNDVKVLGEFFGGALDNNGETIRVLDPFATPLVEISYDDSAIWPRSADGNGATLQLINPDSTPANQLSKFYGWEGSLEYGGSPGRAGAEKIGISIHEVLAHTDAPVTLTDSIELLNVSDQAIDISGWYLSDATSNLMKFRIPDNTMLAPGAYIVFDESHFGVDPVNGFALDSYNGDDIYLTIADDQGRPQSIVDDVHFGPSLNGEPFGRDSHGWLTPLEGVTLGSTNASPRVGPVIISEVQYDPDDPTAADLAIDPNISSGDLEFVEIYNPTTQAVDFTDWRIRGGIEFNFAPDTLLASGEALIAVRFDPESPGNTARLAAFRNHYGLDSTTQIVGGYDLQLRGTGDRVTLTRPDNSITEPIVFPQVISDEVIYDDRLPWPDDAAGTGKTLNRRGPALYGNNGDSWVAAAATPGRVSFAPQPGDFDSDGLVDVTDITLLFNELQSPAPDVGFDLNNDGQVNASDRDVLILEIMGTTYGDSDLDYVFDSTDLIKLFQLGEYEDGIAGNSTWDEGDWNGDGEFDSNDLLLAVTTGGYVATRPEPVPAVAASSRISAISALEADRVLAVSDKQQLDQAGVEAIGDEGPWRKRLLLTDAPAADDRHEEVSLLDAATQPAGNLDEELLTLLATDI